MKGYNQDDKNTLYLPGQHTNYEATGEEVATWANQGTHGGTIRGNNTPHVWDDTMRETIENGELLKLALEYLKSKGFSVRN